jgi:peptidoglycan/xylan/chitin deacetylase (PgdA/CDA1 family)
LKLLETDVRSVALRAGGLRVMREIGRKGVRILLYHRFPASACKSFESQCAHMRKHYNLVSLTQIDAWLRGQEPLPPNSLAVTVDDGYRDFYCTAHPVFTRYQIPVTVFLASDFLDRKCWLWVDQVEYLFQWTRVQSIELAVSGGGLQIFPLSSVEQRRYALTAVKAAAKRMTNEARLALIMEELPDRLKVSFPPEPPEGCDPLAWNEVRTMSADGIDFGAHTMTHPILSSLGGKSQVTEEILGSKRRIEAELDQTVLHFSYPNGTWLDLTPETVEVVKRGGFRTAVIAHGGVNFRNADPFLLRRNTVECDTSEVIFGKDATGFRHQ